MFVGMYLWIGIKWINGFWYVGGFWGIVGFIFEYDEGRVFCDC